jgi:hypothetical protein
MAVAGGGSPGIKLAIYRRELRSVGLMHNVPEQVIRTVDEAAFIIGAGGSCYVSSIAGKAMKEVGELLIAKGLIDVT